MTQWDDQRLWALAETLSARMDAIQRGEGPTHAKPKQPELALGPGGNVVDFSARRRRRGRLCPISGTPCACSSPAAGGSAVTSA